MTRRRRGGGARADLLRKSANCLLVSLHASSLTSSSTVTIYITDSRSQTIMILHESTTAPYLLFLDLAGTGGPLRFLDDDASFAARCACLKRSMLALLCTL